MRFECWNLRCPNYAGAGVLLDAREVHHGAPAGPRCGACGAYVRAVPEPPRVEALLAPAIGGMVIAGAVGGPECAPLGALAVFALWWFWPG